MLAITAAGVVLEYLHETQRTALTHMQGLSRYYLTDFMALDATTQRHLELVRTAADGTREGTVLELLDHTMTAMGGRLLRRWLSEPLVHVEVIRQRQEALAALVEGWMTRDAARDLLKDIADLERITSRINLTTRPVGVEAIIADAAASAPSHRGAGNTRPARLCGALGHLSGCGGRA
jgi:DNA mismatch repair protein MutS